jgi:hypothetical protein
VQPMQLGVVHPARLHVLPCAAPKQLPWLLLIAVPCAISPALREQPRL